MKLVNKYFKYRNKIYNKIYFQWLFSLKCLCTFLLLVRVSELPIILSSCMSIVRSHAIDTRDKCVVVVVVVATPWLARALQVRDNVTRREDAPVPRRWLRRSNSQWRDGTFIFDRSSLVSERLHSILLPSLEISCRSLYRDFDLFILLIKFIFWTPLLIKK